MHQHILSRNIIVGNGDTIPVLGQGTKYLPKPFPPFVLKNVLYSPRLVKNLISVRRFTIDNSVSVEFDPFGFLVKDYKTKAPSCDVTAVVIYIRSCLDHHRLSP